MHSNFSFATIVQNAYITKKIMPKYIQQVLEAAFQLIQERRNNKIEQYTEKAYFDCDQLRANITPPMCQEDCTKHAVKHTIEGKRRVLKLNEFKLNKFALGLDPEVKSKTVDVAYTFYLLYFHHCISELSLQARMWINHEGNTITTESILFIKDGCIVETLTKTGCNNGIFCDHCTRQHCDEIAADEIILYRYIPFYGGINISYEAETLKDIVVDHGMQNTKVNKAILALPYPEKMIIV